MAKRRPDPRCPLRPGEPCTLCQMDATGPHDCGLVYLVSDDDELRELYRKQLQHMRLKGSSLSQSEDRSIGTETISNGIISTSRQAFENN